MVHIFPHSERIWRFPLLNPVLRLNAGKCGSEKLQKRILSKQCMSLSYFFFKIASAKLVQETLSAKGQNLKIRLVTITIDTNAFLKFEDGCE